MMKAKYKAGRRPYKGERWKILVSHDDGKSWRVHSEYTHYSFQQEALKKLND